MDDYNIRRIKGDIAEAICKNHLSAIGLNVEFAGVEHFARTFANRQREDKTDETNEGKIHNYIGLLPDILAGNTNYGHYFVEVKYRSNAKIESLMHELLWKYRKVIFKEYDKYIFPSISPAEWDATDSSLNAQERYCQDIEKNKISFKNIALPILFYILIRSAPEGEEAPKFTLHLLYFDKNDGKFYLHQAGEEPRRTDDVAFNEFISSFDKCFYTIVAPVLNELFIANILIKTPSKPSAEMLSCDDDSLVSLCYGVAAKLKQAPRHGVYFTQLLENKDVAAWLKKKNLTVDRYSLKSELEREGLSTEPKILQIKEANASKNVSLVIKEYAQDFDFYM